MSEFRGREFKIIIAVLLLSGSFLFFGGVKNSDAALLNSYSKLYNGTLTAQEWNNLATDFAKTFGAVTMTGPLSVGTTTIPGSGILVDGPIIASNFSGLLTGGLDAANVMGGNGSVFGSNFGGGNYSFPNNVGIGTSSPSLTLDVLGRGVFGNKSSGRSSYGNTLNLSNNNGTDTSLFLWQNGVASGHIGFAASSNLLRITNSTSDGLITNSAAIVLNTSGNVGIGTTNPTHLLSLGAASGKISFARGNGEANYGTLGFKGTTGNDSYLLELENKSGIGEIRINQSSLTSPVGITMYTSAAERLRIDGAGNVGIGTTNPGAKLDVLGSLRASSATISNVNSGIVMADASGNLYATSSAAATGIPIGGNGQTLRSNGTDWLANSTLFNDGTNIGIGTTTLSERLEVAGNIHLSAGNYIQFGTPGTHTLIKDDASNGRTSISARSNMLDVLTATGGAFGNMRVANVSGGSGATGTLTLDSTTNATKGFVLINPSGGNVGIGTTTPNAKLTITTGKNGQNTMPLSVTGAVNSGTFTDEYGITRTKASAVIGTYWNDTSGAALNVYTYSKDGALFVNGNGNVGIGTTNPGATLDVRGAIASLRANSATLSNIGSGVIMADASGNLYSTSTAAATGIPTPVGINGYTLRSNGTSWIANNLLFNDGTNIGVGTTSPLAKIHSVTPVGGAIPLRGSRDNDAASVLLLERTVGATGALGVDFSSGYSNFRSVKDIAFYYGGSTGGTEAMRILSSSGNVGIGATNPGATLDVVQATQGNIALRAGMSGNPNLIVGTATGFTNLAIANGDYNIIFNTRTNGGATAERFRVGGGAVIDNVSVSNSNFVVNANQLYVQQSSGNVGIGTTTPGATLDVRGAIASFRANSATLSNIGSGVIMADASGNLYSTSTAAATGIPTPVGIAGQTLRSDGTSWVANNTLYNNGTNVGIGTANPGTAKLAVIGGYVGIGTSTPLYPLTIVAPANSNVFGMTDGTRGVLVQTQSSPSNGGIIGYYGGSYNDLDIRATAVTGSQLYIRTTGNVGIGTTNPTQKLEVNGIVKANHFYTGYNWTAKTAGVNLGTDGISGGLGFYDGSTAVSASIFRDTDSNFYVGVRSGQVANGITINTNGNVGIGATSTGATLDVRGAIASFRANSATLSNIGSGVIMADASGNLYSTSTAAATGIPSPSGISGQTLRSNGTSWIANNLLFNDGTNVGIGTTTLTAKLGIQGSGSDILNLFDSAGAEKVSILNSGNVGIGTINPSSLLHIEGNYSGGVDNLIPQMKIINTSTTGGYAFIKTMMGTGYAGGYPELWLQATGGTTGTVGVRGVGNHDMTFWTNNVEKMRLTKDGNVGIGTSSPVAKLAIPGGFASTLLTGDNIVLRKPNYAGGGWARNLMQFEEYDGTVLTSLGMLGSNNTVSYGYLGVAYNSTAMRWYPDNHVSFDNNVGIGTTNPGATLDIGGAIASFRAKSATLSNIGAGLIMADASGNLYSTSSAAATGIPSPAGLNGQTLRSNGTSWVANNLLFNDGTNVGIGTTTLTAKLGIQGSGSDILNLFDSAGAEKVSILNSGNVGIGTTNPGKTLDIISSLDVPLRISSSNSSWSGMEFIATNATGKPYLQLNRTAGGDALFYLDNNNTINIATDGSGTNNRLSILSTGNVGVGTISPGANLEIAGLTGSTLNLNTADSDVSAGDILGNLVFTARNDGSGDGDENKGKIRVEATNSYVGGPSDPSKMVFSLTNGVGVLNDYITLLSGGNVGIGTTTPGATLDVRGAIASFRANSATLSNIGAGLIMADASGNLYSTSTAAATGIPSPAGINGQTLRSNGTSWVANNLLFNDGTNVGIGTTTATYKLEVDGSFGATSNSSSIILDASGNISIGI